MGKVRHNKNKPHKKNPTGLPSVKDAQKQENEEPCASPQENTIQNILEQLQDGNVEEKYCGLQMLALLSEDPNRIDEIVQNNIIRVVAPLMLDNSSPVRNVVAGALRNLSTLGAHVCEVMIDEDIMTPLIASFHEHGNAWIPKDNKNKYDEDRDTIIQLTNLLWNLCEYSETAIKHLNDSHILDILVKYLDRQTFGDDVTIASLQCLFVVTEDNKFAIDKVKSVSEETLHKMLTIDSNEPSSSLQKILAAGIVLNFCLGDITSLSSQVIGLIMSILTTILSVDHRLACNQLSSAIPLEARCSISTPKLKKSKDQVQLESQLKAVQFLLEAQQTSVEIITNLCSLEGIDDDNMDVDNMSDDEDDIIDYDIQDCSNGGLSLSIEDKLPPEVTEGIVANQLFSKVWGKTVLPPENTLQILKESNDGKNVYAKICNLQSRSLLCINNMISCLSIEILGGLNVVYRIWIDAGKVVFKTSNSNDDLLESATSVMRAAMDKIKEGVNNPNLKSELFNSLALLDVELMLNGIRHCDVPTIRANLIRMVGTLALFFVTDTSDSAIGIATAITHFILEHSHKEHEVWVLAESIDVLMDLYSEDETDNLALKIDLVSKMNSLVPLLKNKVRQQKKALGEHSLIVNTALTNLPRFIKYKKNSISKLKS